MRRRTSGFTLVELLVVLVIMGTLVTLVGPLTVRQLENVERTGQREEFLRYLQQTQFNAINFRRPYRVELNGDRFRLFRQQQSIPIIDKSFSLLSFPNQSLTINANGFWQQQQVEWQEGRQQRNKQLTNFGVINE